MEVVVELSRIIDFSPATKRAEIIQNVRMIVSSLKKSIPMFREFGMSKILDQPINIVQARITSQVADAIKRYEPRAKLISIDYNGIIIDGELNPIVTIEV